MIDVVKPGDEGFQKLASKVTSNRLDYADVARAYNEAEVFSILTLQKGEKVTHVGNVRTYLQRWGLTNGMDFLAKVITDPEGDGTSKSLIIEKRTPREMVKPSVTR